MTSVSGEYSLSDQDIGRGGAKTTPGGSNEPRDLKKNMYIIFFY